MSTGDLYRPGWYPDPQRRFELRYHNGQRWTADVSSHGQRYVDSGARQSFQPGWGQAEPSRGIGFAVTSFIVAVVGVLIGWIPFVFIGGAIAAVVAVVFGVLGLQRSRTNDGRGRRFAIAGLAIAPLAVASCVGGWFFTAWAIDHLPNRVDPGRYALHVQQPCVVANGAATLRGSIDNQENDAREYRLTVDVRPDNAASSAAPIEVAIVVADVPPTSSKNWTATATSIGDANTATCTVQRVEGPKLF